ncbi:MAG TPA: hypothetical protein VLA96_02495 [Terriglobales bacterium]|nr:hypothetical protein [Terriglobales bacterium]
MQRTSADLKDLEAAMSRGDIDPRVLLEFREAVNHIRHTTWAVQQWIERRDRKQDPFALVNVFVAERVRVASQVIHELVIDAEACDLELETPNIRDLAREVRSLARHLKTMVPDPNA